MIFFVSSVFSVDCHNWIIYKKLQAIYIKLTPSPLTGSIKKNGLIFYMMSSRKFWHFESDTFRFWHFPIYTLFQFWPFLILTLFDSDTFWFWHFWFWHFFILTIFCSDTFFSDTFKFGLKMVSVTFRLWHFHVSWQKLKRQARGGDIEEPAGGEEGGKEKVMTTYTRGLVVVAFLTFCDWSCQAELINHLIESITEMWTYGTETF